jgi:hypothetical protein
MGQTLTLSTHARRAFDALAVDLRKIFSDRFVCLVATGHQASLALVTSLTADDLDACGPLAHSWHHEGISTPLLLTTDEFSRSLDTFAIEFGAILDRHVVIAGQPPFAGVRIAVGDLRRACETQAKGHLIHLREGWIEAGGHADHAARLLVASAAPLRALLGNVARLQGAAPATREELATIAAHGIGVPADLLLAIFVLEKDASGAAALVPRLPEYLAAAERLWAFVDSWQA